MIPLPNDIKNRMLVGSNVMHDLVYAQALGCRPSTLSQPGLLYRSIFSVIQLCVFVLIVEIRC